MRRRICVSMALLLCALLIGGTAFASLDGTITRQYYGSNMTQLPIVGPNDPPVTLTVWSDLNSTVMDDMNQCAVYPELEKRTGVKIKWEYPPTGQATENFTLRISTGDLPDMFMNAPDYPGGLEKGVADQVLLPINSYYDKGLTPNYKYLRDKYPEIAMNTVTDSGMMVEWNDLDYVPSSPWSGLWVRKDWLDAQGLQVPVTLKDWDTMLRKFKDAYGAVLGLNIKDWYGVRTNFAFSAAYDTGYDWINKDGVVEYGPASAGYKEFLTLLHGWYADGLYDPDFATRTYESYNANVSNGVYGAFGQAYGDTGPTIVAGKAKDPNFQVLAVRQPVAYDGQVIKLRQTDSIVRWNHDFLTYQCVTDGVDEIAMKWKDYWYSQEGGDLFSYGPEGVSYQWDANDHLQWIYNDTGVVPAAYKDLDFWTVLPLFKVHVAGYLRDSTSYKNVPEVWQCIDEWAKDNPVYYYPDWVSLTTEEDQERSAIEVNMQTYREEMTYKFITGQESLDNFDNYVEELKGMGLDDCTAIKQAGLDRYLAR